MTIGHVLIMAAGRGNRMRPLTDVIPKALAPFNGSTLIENVIRNFLSHNINIHVTIGYLGSILSEVLTRKQLVSTVLNTNGHDNAWWLFNTLLKHVDKPVLVMTCDNVTDLDVGFIESQYYALGAPPCMLVPVKPIESIDGDYLSCNKDRAVTSISRLNKTGYYASGIQVVNPLEINKIINDCENFNDVWKQLIKLNKLYVSDIYTKSWFSIDSLEQLAIRSNDLANPSS